MNLVYIESTIPSYLAARPASDLVQAAKQLITWEWWEKRASKYRLCVSDIVLREIELGDPAAASRRVALVSALPRLVINEEVQALAEKFVSAGLLPIKAYPDAFHVAVATVHNVDFLLTWNCRHIANGTIMNELRDVAIECGYQFPILCTPQSLMWG